MSECSVDFPRESDSQRSHQEPDLGSDDRRRDCGDRQLEGAYPLTGNGVRHALDFRWRPGRCLSLNRWPWVVPSSTNRIERYAADVDVPAGDECDGGNVGELSRFEGAV